MLPGSTRRKRARPDKVAELRLRIFDRGLIATDLCGQLIDHRLLRVDLLLGCEVLVSQALVTIEIELGIFQISFVLCLLGLRLGERGLIRPRVNLH